MLGAVVVALLAQGTPATAGEPAPVPSTTAAAPAPTETTTPSSTPVPAHLSTGVAVDKKSTISVTLATGSVSVRFRTGALSRRPVSLQRLVGDAWVEVGRKKMDAQGRVRFAAGAYRVESVYRAVELRYKSRTLRATRPTGWNSTLYDSFTGSQLNDQHWSLRPSANQGPRYCSRTTMDAISVTGGALVASVDYLKDETLAKQYHQTALQWQKQGCWWGWEKSPTGLGVYDTAMITTQDKLVVNTAKPGMVAARIKFPLSQGMHGAVWLQNPTKAEIDMIEGFGYGRGISNYIHTASKKTLDASGPATYKLGAYVLSSKTKSKSWWRKFHTYSISWTASGFEFRVDGAVTQRVKVKPGDVDYSLVISLLVSDWEAYRITAPITKGFKDVVPASLPETMSVDWVKVWTKA